MEVPTQAFNPLPMLADNGTDVNMTDAVEGTEKVKKFPKFLRGVGADGKVLKKKKRSMADKNKLLKKRVQPKNAVVCLNELRPGIPFKTESESGFGKPVCVSVEVDGKKFIGTGNSKQLAKQDAAEAALASFVKPIPDKAATAEGGDVPEETTPWGVLASFAMYKLFNKWVTEQPAHGYVAMQPQVVQVPIPSRQVDIQQKQAISTYLGKPAQPMVQTLKNNENAVPSQNPAKELPANASTMHPMMLLHQMFPGLKLHVMKQRRETDQQMTFQISCTVKDQQFIGEGTSMKKAKLDLASKTNEKVFGVVYAQL